MTVAGRSFAKILMILLLTVGTAAALKPMSYQYYSNEMEDAKLTSWNLSKNLEECLLGISIDMSVNQVTDQRI